MAKPWDRPPTWPCRTGDKRPSKIYEAVGRAISAWEGVEVAMLGLFSALCDDIHEVKRFAKTFKIQDRCNKIRKEIDGLSRSNQSSSDEKLNCLIEKLVLAVEAYEGWSQRRNDVAHGYVTPQCNPDYSDSLQPIRRSHSLCPSHTNINRWHQGDPEYNFDANDVRGFAREFIGLDEEIVRLTQEFKNYRSGRDSLRH